MNITVQRRTFDPVDGPVYDAEFFSLLESFNKTAERIELYEEQETGLKEGMYTEEGGLFGAIGKGIVTLITKLIEGLTRLLSKDKENGFRNMTETEKLNAICKEYPAFSDQIMVAVSSGLLDVNAMKDATSFIREFDQIRQLTEDPTRNMGRITKKLYTLGNSLEKINEHPAFKVMDNSAKIIKTVSSFTKSINKVGDIKSNLDRTGHGIANGLKNTAAKKAATKNAKNQTRGQVFTASVEIDYNEAKEQSNPCLNNISGLEGIVKQLKAYGYNPDTGTFASSSSTKVVPEAEPKVQSLIGAAIEKVIAFVVNAIYSLTGKADKQHDQICDATSTVAKHVQALAKRVSKYGSYDSYIEAVRAGKEKLPESLTLKGNKIIINV